MNPRSALGKIRFSFSRRILSAPEPCQSCSQTGRPQKRKGGGAPVGARKWSAPHSQMLPPEGASGADARHGRSACANPPLAGALASRRSAAALVAGRTNARLGPGRASRDAVAKVLPPPFASRLSQAPGSPVIMPAGTMPGPPGSGLRDRPREPHSLHFQDGIRKAPFAERAAALLLGALTLSSIVADTMTAD